MKFHFDENVNEVVAIGLRARGIDVTTTNEVGLKRAPDEEQIAFALAQNRVLVSHDEDMLSLAASGTTHAGVAYCAMGKYDVGGLVRRLLRLVASIGESSMLNRVEYL